MKTKEQCNAKNKEFKHVCLFESALHIALEPITFFQK